MIPNEQMEQHKQRFADATVETARLLADALGNNNHARAIVAAKQLARYAQALEKTAEFDALQSMSNEVFGQEYLEDLSRDLGLLPDTQAEEFSPGGYV